MDRNRVTIRPMVPSEQAQFISWLLAHKDVTQLNEADKEILKRKQALVLVAQQNNEILCFLPVALFWQFMPIAPRPELPSHSMVKVALAAVDYLKEQAIQGSVPALKVSPNDSRFSKFLQRLKFVKDDRETLVLDCNAKPQKPNS